LLAPRSHVHIEEQPTKRFAVLSLCLSLCTYLLGAFAAAPPPGRSSATLIEQLGSDRFEERERATRQLMELATVPPELRSAMKSSDAEVRRRAARIIAAIEKRIAQMMLREATALAKDGEIDQAIERAVRWAEQDRSAEGPKGLHGLVKHLVAKQGRLIEANLAHALDNANLLTNGGTVPGVEFVERRGEPRPLQVKMPLARSALFLRGAGVTVRGDGGGYIISTGPVALSAAAARIRCVILSCGAVQIDDFCVNVIVVCDGDVCIRGKGLYASVIVARGKVTIPTRAVGCVVVAGGTIVRQPGRTEEFENPVLREKDASGLGVIKFFDPARVGIEVTAARQGVQVKKAHAGKPFATLLREGDVVQAIGDSKVGSVEAFRKALRAELAEGTKSITLSLRRDGQVLDVRVPVRR
jgi:hypothetical protein